VRGDIAYHFMPGVEGQVRGDMQFAEVAPQYGPKDFKVRLSGALLGHNPSNDPKSARVFLDKWGLGVLNPAAGKDVGIQGQVQLDGRHGGEFIRMEFATAVRITLLTFASVGVGEGFELYADGAPVDLQALFPGPSSIRELSAAHHTWPGTIDFKQGQQPTVFAKRWEVVVRGSPFDGIQLENVEVQAVPEPSTLLLASLGIVAGGIWSLRRRRRQTS